MDMETLSDYISLFKIDGQPIIPPVMTDQKRASMIQYRAKAIEIERCLVEKILIGNKSEESVVGVVTNGSTQQIDVENFDSDSFDKSTYQSEPEFELTSNLSQIISDNLSSDTESVRSDDRPRLIRSNSYTLETPSPLFVQHMKEQAVINGEQLENIPVSKPNPLSKCRSGSILTKRNIKPKGITQKRIVTNSVTLKQKKSPYELSIHQQITTGSKQKSGKRKCSTNQQIPVPIKPKQRPQSSCPSTPERRVQKPTKISSCSTKKRPPSIVTVPPTVQQPEPEPEPNKEHVLNDILAKIEIEHKRQITALIERQQNEQKRMNDEFLKQQELLLKQFGTGNEREYWAATIISAYSRGYLVRRLFRTKYVQSIVKTIQDTLLFLLDMHHDTQQIDSPADIKLKYRLIQQLTATCSTLHDVFFATTIAERMKLIEKDRRLIMSTIKRTVSDQSTGSAVSKDGAIKLSKISLFSLNIGGKDSDQIEDQLPKRLPNVSQSTVITRI